MLQVSTNVKPIRYGRIFAVLLLLLLSPLVFCYVATPTVIVYYPKEAKEKLGSVWNTQHRIYRGGRGGLYPGEVTLDFGHIFPNENFFMEFYWWGTRSVTIASISPLSGPPLVSTLMWTAILIPVQEVARIRIV